MNILDLLLIMGALSGHREGKECPMCAEISLPRARICRFCGYMFDPSTIPPDPPKPKPPEKDCPKCGTVNKGRRTVCQACGYYFQED